MSPNLFQAFQIFSQFALHVVSQDLCIFTINDIALPVQEPGWYLVLCRILDYGDNAFQLFRRNISGAGGGTLSAVGLAVNAG